MDFITRFMLEQGSCLRHVLGSGKGKHVIYASPEKVEYECQFCDCKANSILELTKEYCPKHPFNIRKGRHLPKL